MKILHVTKKYPNALGGDATIVNNIEKQQEIKGHEVYILVSNCKDIINKPNLFKFGLVNESEKLDQIGAKRIFSLIVLFCYSFILLKKLKPDIIHSHSADMGFVISFACRLYGIPIVDAVHGFTFPDPQHSLFKRYSELFFLKHSNFKSIMSEDGYGKDFFQKYNLKNFVYIPNGIDLSSFQKELKISSKKINILFIGRLEKQKGLEYLMEALRILKDQTQNFEVKIVGDGSELVTLKTLVEKYGLNKFVKFIGKVNHSQTVKYYFASDIFVLPSIWEGFPVTLLEAWGAKLPTIITNVGGIAKICKNNINAIIVPPRNPGEIAKSILTLINDSNLGNELGERGYKLVKSKYTWEKIESKVMDVYKEACS